jgi:type IV pilus assembly protein PilW
MSKNKNNGNGGALFTKRRGGSVTGFSLIELMVGIVVSLICTLAIMAAFAIFEGQKRTTSAGDDAQQNGSYALYYLERQIRTAGSGLVQGNLWGIWGCPVVGKTSGVGVAVPAAPASLPFSIWPSTTRAVSVLIESGGSNNVSDVIGVVSGSAAARVFVAPVANPPSATGNTSVTLSNSFGIQNGDYLLGVTANSPTNGCPLALSNSAPAANVISLDSANSVASGLTGATSVFDLGPDPIMSLYGVDPTINSLVTYDLLQRPINGVAAANIPVADGIVLIKALYGVHDGTCGSDADCIGSWQAPTGNWAIGTLSPTALSATSVTTAATAMNSIKAIRVAVVAQSRISQRSSDYSPVGGGTSITLFTDLPAAQQIQVTTDPTYRYKIYDTTIPIRNAQIQKYF